MKIRLKKKQNQYAQVSVQLLRDGHLSLKSKGLGALLESYSNDFEISVKSIEYNATDGIKSIRSAIKELEKGYYLFRFQTRDKHGLFITYWAFDSQKLDVEYLKEMIFELEKVELITQNKLLERGSPHGDAVTDTPSAACRSTGCRQSTTYNNNTYKNRKDKNSISPQKRDFTDFRQEVLEQYPNKVVCIGAEGFLSTTPISITALGYLHNKVSGKDLSPQDAQKVWTWLFANPGKLQPLEGAAS